MIPVTIPLFDRSMARSMLERVVATMMAVDDVLSVGYGNIASHGIAGCWGVDARVLILSWLRVILSLNPAGWIDGTRTSRVPSPSLSRIFVIVGPAAVAAECRNFDVINFGFKDGVQRVCVCAGDFHPRCDGFRVQEGGGYIHDVVPLSKISGRPGAISRSASRMYRPRGAWLSVAAVLCRRTFTRIFVWAVQMICCPTFRIP